MRRKAQPSRRHVRGPGAGGNAQQGKLVSVAIACVVLPDGVELVEEIVNTLKLAVHEALGASCVPADFVRIPAIPRTHNGKAMRQVVQRLFAGKFPGDVSEMSNPECLHDLKSSIAEWREGQKASYTLDSGLDG